MHQTQGNLCSVQLTLARAELSSLHQMEHEVSTREIFHHKEQFLLALNKKHFQNEIELMKSDQNYPAPGMTSGAV